MVLKTVKVQRFKSIIDSGVFPVESRATCLVGKNESGKTAILEALYRLNPVAAGHRRSFIELYDYPRRKRGTEKSHIPQTTPIEAVFELEDDDIKTIEERFGEGVFSSREVTVKKNYENKRIWNFNIDQKKVISNLVPRQGWGNDVTRGCSNLEELRKKLTEMESRPEAMESLLAKISNLDPDREIREILASRLPKFLYFNNYSVMPGRFSIPYLQGAKESNLTPDERTALSLLRLAGVATEEFLETNYEARRAALESAAVQIADEVFEYWSQNKDLRVEFDADFKSAAEHGKNPPFLEVRIWDDRHKMSLNFSERSTGFVWFFSFLAFFSEYRNTNEKFILLLDEPGFSLHASAQADLVRFLDERLAAKNQIIYTTHSPFMIKAAELERARTVEVIKDTGTIVSTDVFAAGKETIFPLQAALGYELAQTLFAGPDNLVVEGPSDILYLQILSEFMHNQGRTGLDPRWTLVPAGGIEKIPAFIALLGGELNISVLLETATGGNQRIGALVQRGILAPNRLIPLAEFIDGKEADIEDLFETDFYLHLLKQSGIDIKGEDINKGNRIRKRINKGNRIRKRIETNLGRIFNHYQPAAHFLRNQASLLEMLNTKTLDRFEHLFKKINTTIS